MFWLFFIHYLQTRFLRITLCTLFFKYLDSGPFWRPGCRSTRRFHGLDDHPLRLEATRLGGNQNRGSQSKGVVNEEKNGLARSLGVCEICERDSIAELGIFLAEGEILFETLWKIFFTLLSWSCPQKKLVQEVEEFGVRVCFLRAGDSRSFVVEEREGERICGRFSTGIM